MDLHLTIGCCAVSSGGKEKVGFGIQQLDASFSGDQVSEYGTGGHGSCLG